MRHREPRSIVSLGASLLVAAAVLLTPGWALARKRDKSPEEERAERQLELNDQAIEAMIAEDYPHAIELLQESLDLGELNITWLNLGRAYSKAGRCTEALTAYDRMAVAPRVEEPPPEVLYDILKGYRDELLTQCPGKVTVRCNPTNLEVSIDDAPPVACPEVPVELPAGIHVVRGLHEGVVVQERIVDVEGLSVSYVELDAPPPVMEFRPIDSPSDDILWGVAIGSLATGGALLVAGIATGVVAGTQEDEQRALIEEERFVEAADIAETGEQLALASNVLLGCGGGLLVVGATLAIAAAVTGDDDGAGEGIAGVRPDLTISPERVGLTLSTRF